MPAIGCQVERSPSLSVVSLHSCPALQHERLHNLHEPHPSSRVEEREGSSQTSHGGSVCALLEEFLDLQELREEEKGDERT